MSKAFEEAFDKVKPGTDKLIAGFLEAGCAMNDSLGTKQPRDDLLVACKIWMKVESEMAINRFFLIRGHNTYSYTKQY